MKIVICGGGIIGCATAYYLAKRGVACTVIERCGIACSASGKAGGFLAKDWSDGTDIEALCQKSYDMHMELARDAHFKDCDYRMLDTLSVRVKEGKQIHKRPELPEWLNGPVDTSQTIGTTSTTAQVHPYKLTNAFFDFASATVGSTLHCGVVEGVHKVGSKAAGVIVSGGKVIAADVVVFAMGPWCSQVCGWFNIPPIVSRRAHSIVMRHSKPVSPTGLFVEFRCESGAIKDPEVFPRPDNTVYMCGEGDSTQLPDDPNDIRPNASACQSLKRMAGEISSNLSEATVETSQVCYVPDSHDGVPMIGAVPGLAGAYIAGGHSVWGILNAPITGLALTELILNGKSSTVDISAFDPGRFQ